MLKDRDSKQSIQVTIRVRPLSEKQLNEDSRICVRLQQSNSLHLNLGNDVKKFTFDSICFNQSQQQIFNRVGKKCTVDCLEGYNCTIFAYGQTGAGKTYTMMGVNFQNENYFENRGLIPRTMEFLFECIDRERENGVNFIIRCSFLEIYNEQIIDLLNKSNNNLQLRQDTRKGVYVEGITEQIITKSEQAMEILNKGSKSRHVGSTFYNQTSSRSHSVFTMQIESKYTKNGVSNTKCRQFNFIDLAGSERTKQSTGERLKEGCNINKSLMNLAAVINALSEVSEGKMQHVNYRNSKLTFLLKDSLGGNSKTNLIANISPATVFYQQSLSTLGFARRAKLIKREKASINEDSSGNLESMKNQIKRLKQEVISLMSRVQSNGNNPSSNTVQPEKPSEMTTIMHQYVEEEIDKQTKLQLEILKLNERIIHLQNGIKQYSNNEIHLRMIISVYEDKINRLKNIQKTLNQNLSNLNQNDPESKAIIAYFKTERNNFIKELESIKGQSQNNKFLKQLLKQAKIMKQDGEDESLKELLIKNTDFLNTIRVKLDEMKPEKIQFEINSEFQKKITLMQQQYSKKEEEYQERLDQLNLDLSQFKTRNEQNEKLLQQAINGQIVLQEKVKEEQGTSQKLNKEVVNYQDKIKHIENENLALKTKTQQTIQELKNEINDKQSQAALAKKQVQTLKTKIEKAALHQNALKAEFENLQEEKYKLDKQLLQTNQELRESKNALLKSESQVAILQRKIELLVSENSQLKAEITNIQEISTQKQNTFKNTLEQAFKTYQIQLEKKMSESQELMNKIQNQNAEIQQLNEKLVLDSEALSLKIAKLKEIEEQQKSIIANQQQKIKQMLTLVNEKQLNGNETAVQLNQVKIQLINAHSQMETIQIKYKKMVEELKEKLQKEQTSCEQAEAQLTQKTNLYQIIKTELNHKQKECTSLSENLNKINAKANLMEQEMTQQKIQLEQFTSQLNLLKNKEKQQKNIIMEIKNQLFVLQKNSEIEIDTLESEINAKDQQIEQSQKDFTKTKQRLEKQIHELRQDIENLNDSFRSQEQNLYKINEANLAAKQKKIMEIKKFLLQKQQKMQEFQHKISEISSQNEKLKQTQVKLTAEITAFEDKNKIMSENLEQLKQQLEEANDKSQKEIEEMQIIHNEQIDQKNEQIETFMIQNQTLNNRIQQARSEIQLYKKTNASLLSEISIKNQNYKEILEQNSELHVQIQKMKEQMTQIVTNSQNQVSNIRNQYQGNLSQALKQFKQLKEKLIQADSIVTRQQKEKEELQINLTTYQSQTERLKNQTSEYVNSISLLTQENHGLNQQLTENFNEKNATEEKLAHLQAIQLKTQGEKDTEILNLSQLNKKLATQLEHLQTLDLDNKQKLVELNKLTNQLTKSLQSERSAASKLIKANQSLESTVSQLKTNLMNTQSDLQKFIQQTARLKEIQAREAVLSSKFEYVNATNTQLLSSNQQLTIKYNQINDKYTAVESQLAKISEQYKLLTSLHDETKEKQGKENNVLKTQNTFLIDENRRQASQIINLSKTNNDFKLENSIFKQKISKFEQHHQKLNNQIQELHLIKQKWELQVNEMDKIRSQIEEEKSSKERIYNELCREKESNNNLKMLIENKSAQYMQLELELEQKDSIYKKLVEKIAKNESQNKKTTNSEHYLKTIELLEKSRAQQIQLRRQNEELKKVMMTMKETIQQKQSYAREVEQKSQGYCVSMHKRMEEIQNDYVELQRNHEKLIKERKHYSHDNQQLKDEIKNLKINVAKLQQQNKEMDDKIKKASIDYVQLEKEYEEIKRNECIIPMTDQKERASYINKLKAEVAALKTERAILNDTLAKQREEKTKLKAQMRYGKDGNTDITIKLDLEKKINQNKNLTELIFQVISQLKICVNEPKTKLQVIRTTILGAIKEKNTEIKTLKEKIKECESEHYRQVPTKADYPVVHRETRELKALSITNSNKPVEESTYKFQKEKDPSFLSNNSRQKMKEFEKYYAKFKSGDGENKSKNI